MQTKPLLNGSTPTSSSYIWMVVNCKWQTHVLHKQDYFIRAPHLTLIQGQSIIDWCNPSNLSIFLCWNRFDSSPVYYKFSISKNRVSFHYRLIFNSTTWNFPRLWFIFRSLYLRLSLFLAIRQIIQAYYLLPLENNVSLNFGQ